MPQSNSTRLMELQIFYSILFIFFCFLLGLSLSRQRSASKKSLNNLPPGPWKLPLIGNMHQLIGSLPHQALTNLANKYGPIMHIQMGEISYIVISSPEIVQEVLKTHDAIFANRFSTLAAKTLFYDATDIVFSPYGSYWRQLRKICTLELLTLKRVQSFRFIREEEVSSLLNDLFASEGSVVNLSEKISTVIIAIVARAAFGEKSRDQGAFLSLLKDIIKLLSGLTVIDQYPSIKVLPVLTGFKWKIERVHRKCDKILENIVREHKEKKINHVAEEEDLVDVLLKNHQGDEQDSHLTLNNIKAVILDIFAAGTETAATVLVWVMSELIRNPKALEKAQAEIRSVFDRKGSVDESELHQLKYLNMVIKETLRLHPPATLLPPRENSETCIINGYEIPAKTKTIVNVWAIGRDSRYWSEPEKFQPERFIKKTVDFRGTNFELIPFGAGRRICPGITFAMSNVELVLANLLYHFDWKLPKGMKHEDLNMTESFGISVGRKTDLCSIPISYRP